VTDRDDAYSEVAWAQLDELAAGPYFDLYNAVLDACALVLEVPDQMRKHSTSVTTREGVVLSLPVTGYGPYKVFWSTSGPRIEAVFPYER